MSKLAKYRKALGALLGAVTGGAVMFVLHQFGVDVTVEVATSIAGVLAAAGAALSPKNDYGV